MAMVWSAAVGLGGYVLWSGPSYTILRSPLVNRVLGLFILSYGSYQLARTAWMLTQRKPAIEMLPEGLVVRGAGPPTRRIPWDEIESVSGAANGVTLRYEEKRRLTVNSIILQGPNGADGRRLADRINEARQSR
ncbi:MAG: hypothetical protein GY788_07860 [bacterium]|nr:hypothetical protein [bacterium]